MITRRKFITSSTAVIAAAVFSPVVFSSSSGRKLDKIGFISGIIDKELKGDWKSVLRKTAEFGYTEIETGGFLGESAEGFLSFCKEIGLTPVAGGINFTNPNDKILKSLDLISSLKMKYAVAYWPWYSGGPFTIADCRKSADQLNNIGSLCSEHGLTFCWHNHNKEFMPMDEGLPYDYLMAHTYKDLVKCEMDIYWVLKGGADPVKLLKKYSGRYVILHVKDMSRGADQDFECPGSGIIDFPSIFSEAADQGIEHYFVERDNVIDGMECLRTSAGYLKNLRFK
jgi:sugar phosphate isomerase/epimerase